jgi:hypothetical protein
LRPSLIRPSERTGFSAPNLVVDILLEGDPWGLVLDRWAGDQDFWIRRASVTATVPT